MLVTKTDISIACEMKKISAAGDEHGGEAERERQRRRGQRAEDAEQDQQHDREAGLLGLREVLLGELLHRRPTARPGRRGASHAVRAPSADAELLAQVDGDVGRLVVVDVDAQRHDERARPPRPALRAARPPRQRDAVDRPVAASTRDRARDLRRVAPARDEHDGQLTCARRRGSDAARPPTGCDCEPGTPNPPLDRCSDWRIANGTAATRTATQAPSTERRRRLTEASSRIMAAASGAPGTGWLASQLTGLRQCVTRHTAH